MGSFSIKDWIFFVFLSLFCVPHYMVILSLKASSSIQDESDKEDSIEIDEHDDLSLFIKRFNKFLRVRGNQRRSNFK